MKIPCLNKRLLYVAQWTACYTILAVAAGYIYLQKNLRKKNEPK